MAQRETGYGWSAKEEWLIAGTGIVAQKVGIGGAAFPGQPIPKNLTTALDVVSNGFHFFHFQQQYFGQDWYAASGDDNDILIAALPIGQEPNNYRTYYFRAISAVPTTLYMGIQQTGISPGAQLRTISISTQDAGTGLYIADWAGSVLPVDPPDSNVTCWAPTFPDMATAMSQVETYNINYNKLNPGYAVAALAEWYSPGGLNLISPVLISTVPENTIITTDGTTPAAGMETFNFLYDGARFYMSLIAGNTVQLNSSAQHADLRQFGAAAPSKVFSLLAEEDFSNIIVGVSPDPYNQEGGESGEEGGDGDTDPEDEPVEEETLPIPAISGLGFSTIYVPTAYDLYTLAAYLWGGNLNLDNFLRLFANPMDSILGLSAVPVPLSGTYEPIYLGGQMLRGVTMPRYTGRTAVKVDMGTTTISERWGSYLDYDPYTELSIYLPFIGIKNIKADDVMGKTVSLMYNIDILSGACVAYIRTAGGSVLYEWAGQCAMQIPITGSNWDNIFSTAISTAVTLGGAMVAPASAPMLAGSVASAAVQAVAAKPRVERSGAVTGVTGFLGQLRPYIIRTIPEAYIPADQNKFIGYPAYINVALSGIRGYNEVDSIHLENVPATGAELEEIESILKGGVIF